MSELRASEDLNDESSEEQKDGNGQGNEVQGMGSSEK
jgi:hypothetical protein